MCEYEFRNGERCKEEALPNSKYCILHIDLPEDEESDEFKRINELKEEKVKEKISKEDFNFEGAKLSKVDFSEMSIEVSLAFDYAVIRNGAWFNGAEICGDASFYEAKIGGKAAFVGAKIGGKAAFSGAEIGGDAWFGGAEIGGHALFYEAEIGGKASFVGAKIGGDVWFNGAEICGAVSFSGAEIGGDAWFGGAEICGAVSFYKAKIDGKASFDGAEICGAVSFYKAKIDGKASFDGAKIGGAALFSLTEIKGVCSFKDATFEISKAQEEACRTARRTQERIGDRVSADYHFYREMEAKRKQKNPVIRFVELPVQYIFGYGVHPWRAIATWLLTVFSLAFVYWLGNGVEAAESLVECIYFSVVTAATPGYGGYHPKPGFYQGLASFEAIFGTFMWAAFIATFARKYMR